MKRSLLTFLLVVICFAAYSNASEYKPKAVYRFKLTKLLGKALLKPATFTVNTASTDWVLNMNNGKTVTYKILSGSDQDPLCGLSAKDSLGDKCEICIQPGQNDAVTIVFKYGSHKYVYTGNLIR